MKFLFYIFILTHAFKSIAEFQEMKCKSTGLFNQFFADIHLKEPCKELEHLREVIKDINKFTHSKSSLTLFLEKEDYTASVSASGLMILSNRQKGFKEVRDLKKTKIIWAHEYGHVIFNSFLSQNFKPFKEFEAYMLKHDEISIKNLTPHADNFKAVKSYWTANTERVRDIQKAFSETFADLIAVLYAEDISAMKKAMKVKGMGPTQLANLRYYDFDPEINNTIYKGLDEHFVLSPVKAYIGKHFLKFPMNYSQKQELANKVLNIFIKEIKMIWEHNTSLDFQKINLYLTKEIRSNL